MRTLTCELKENNPQNQLLERCWLWNDPSSVLDLLYAYHLDSHQVLPFISTLFLFLPLTPFPPFFPPSYSRTKTYSQHIRSYTGTAGLPSRVRDCESSPALRIASVFCNMSKADGLVNSFVIMTSLAGAQSCGDSGMWTWLFLCTRQGDISVWSDAVTT